MNGQNWRYGGSWDRLANDPHFFAFHEYPWERRIRSVVVSGGRDGVLHAILHSGSRDTDMVVRLELRPRVVNHQLELKVESTDFDATGPSGVFITIATNIIYYSVKWIAQALPKGTVTDLLHDTAVYGSGIVVDHDIFTGMPSGMAVKSKLVDVQLTPDTLTAGYAINCTP